MEFLIFVRQIFCKAFFAGEDIDAVYVMLLNRCLKQTRHVRNDRYHFSEATSYFASYYHCLETP